MGQGLEETAQKGRLKGGPGTKMALEVRIERRVEGCRLRGGSRSHVEAWARLEETHSDSLAPGIVGRRQRGSGGFLHSA